MHFDEEILVAKVEKFLDKTNFYAHYKCNQVLKIFDIFLRLKMQFIFTNFLSIF